MNLYSFNASGPDRSNEPAFVEQLRLQVELSSNLSAFYENHELYVERAAWPLCGACDGCFGLCWARRVRSFYYSAGRKFYDVPCYLGNS